MGPAGGNQLCPDWSKSPLSPAKHSRLPLGSERATPTRPTPPPTAHSPARLPPRPAGPPTPVWPTGLRGSVGGEGRQNFWGGGEPVKVLSGHLEFGGPSPESWDQVCRFPTVSLALRRPACGALWIDCTIFKTQGLCSCTLMLSECHFNPLWPLARTSRPPRSKTLYSCFRKLENTYRDDQRVKIKHCKVLSF